MAAQTGRTVTKFCKVQIHDSGATLRDINVKSISGIGVDYADVDLTALNDPATGSLPGIPTVKISITCVYDTSVVQACSVSTEAPKFSGSHTVLSALNGLMTPLTFAYYVGIRQYWTAGEPVFGGAGTATSGFLVRNYQDNGEECTADLILYPGSTLPAWGIAVLA